MLTIAVQSRMASFTKCNQVLLGIGASMTTKLLVMHLELAHCAAILTSPSISAQDPFTDEFVFAWTDSLPSHAIDSQTHALRFRLFSGVKNWTKRKTHRSSTSGLLPSRLAPAKKSAQIISRQ
jgi:hypothetical protein